MPVVDYAPTRIYRQVRQTPAPARPAVVVVDPDARGSQLAHPRLVPRTRPPRASSHRDFDDEPTGVRS